MTHLFTLEDVIRSIVLEVNPQIPKARLEHLMEKYLDRSGPYLDLGPFKPRRERAWEIWHDEQT